MGWLSKILAATDKSAEARAEDGEVAGFGQEEEWEQWHEDHPALAGPDWYTGSAHNGNGGTINGERMSTSKDIDEQMRKYGTGM